jgi:glycosyltransferase involved in cell wall biosynthesis
MKNPYPKKKVFIVIPAYNEEKAIGKVLDELLENNYKNIVVVDDKSKDNTVKEISKRKVILVKHKVNQGQGAALRNGIKKALKQGAEYIVTFDSDGQHRVEDLPIMLKPVVEENYEVALGSRFLKKTKIPFKRMILLKGSLIVQWIFYGLLLSDVHNGYRVFNKKAAKIIKITCNRMEHASEIIEEIAKKKLNYKEVPVTIRYTDYSMQKGHGSFWQAVKVLMGMIKKRYFSKKK